METRTSRIKKAIAWLHGQDIIAKALALGHSSAHTTTAIYIERKLSKVDAANRKVLYLFL